MSGTGLIGALSTARDELQELLDLHYVSPGSKTARRVRAAIAQADEALAAGRETVKELELLVDSMGDKRRERLALYGPELTARIEENERQIEREGAAAHDALTEAHTP